MVREAFVYDLFFGEYTGGLHDWELSKEYGDEGRKHPIIKKMKTRAEELPRRADKEKFPYALAEEEDTIRIETDAGYPIILLVPDPSIPELSKREYRKTIGYRLNREENKEIERLNAQLEQTENLMKSFKKDKRQLSREREEMEEAEQEKKITTSSSGVTCPGCDATNSEKKWKDNNEFCPSCDDVKLDEAKG